METTIDLKALTGGARNCGVRTYAVLGDQRPIVVPYSPPILVVERPFQRPVLRRVDLGAQAPCAGKGYTFLGTNSNGVNAFFVKDEFAEPVPC